MAEWPLISQSLRPESFDQSQRASKLTLRDLSSSLNNKSILSGLFLSVRRIIKNQRKTDPEKITDLMCIIRNTWTQMPDRELQRGPLNLRTQAAQKLIEWDAAVMKKCRERAAEMRKMKLELMNLRGEKRLYEVIADNEIDQLKEENARLKEQLETLYSLPYATYEYLL